MKLLSDEELDDIELNIQIEYPFSKKRVQISLAETLYPTEKKKDDDFYNVKMMERLMLVDIYRMLKRLFEDSGK